MPVDDWVPAGIGFDLDGTLADTLPDLASAIDAAMRSLGLQECGAKRVRTWIGQGTEKLVERALTHTMQRTPAPAELSDAVDLFHAKYDQTNGRETVPFPQAESTLAALRNAGLPFACVTNKRSRFTLPLIEQLGWTDLFAAVVCGDDAASRKPEPGLLLDAAASMGIAPEDMLMIGDSKNDAMAARNAGMRLALVTYGYLQGATIEELRPDYRLESLIDLFQRFPALKTALRQKDLDAQSA